MADKWISAKLGEYIDSCLGKMLDKQKNRGDFHPYLGNKNVRWGDFDLDDLAEMRFEKHEHERYGLEYGDLIVCEGGEPGRCAIWRDQIPGMKIQKALHRVRTKPGLNNVYLYYWFMYAGRYGLLEPYFTGTTIKHLTGKSLSELDISIPPLSHQEKVAYLLGGLDEKIELNRQMNETLEQMAQALFKSWFVDFDPVIDNALDAGNPIPEELEARAEQRRQLRDAVARGEASVLGMPDEIRSLFPSEFELTEEMGWIPKGWYVSTTHDEFDIKGGSTPSTKNPDFWEYGDIHWTSPKDLSGKTDKVLLDTERKITRQGLDKITSGLLPINTVLMSSRAPVGYLALAKVPVAINQGYIALICEKTITPEYTIQWLSSVMDEIKSISGGTTFSEISKKTFRSIKLVVPEEKVVAEYTKYVAEYYERITQAAKESDSLSALRDYLLPKLISGELQIPDTEQQIAAALS